MCGGAVHIAPKQLPSPCGIYRAPSCRGASHRGEQKIDLGMPMHAMASANIASSAVVDANEAQHQMQNQARKQAWLHTRYKNVDMLLPLLCTPCHWMTQQPVVQQQRIYRRHIWLTPQSSAHVQQIICSYFILRTANHLFTWCSVQVGLLQKLAPHGCTLIPCQKMGPELGKSGFPVKHSVGLDQAAVTFSTGEIRY